jgi:hypothetical protein
LKWFASFSFFLCFSCYSEDTHWVSQDTMNKTSACALHQVIMPSEWGVLWGVSAPLSRCLFQEHTTLRPLPKTKTLLFQKTYRPAYRLPKKNYALNKQTT